MDHLYISKQDKTLDDKSRQNHGDKVTCITTIQYYCICKHL